MNFKKNAEPAIVEVGFMPNSWGAGGIVTPITDTRFRFCRPAPSTIAVTGDSVSHVQDAV